MISKQIEAIKNRIHQDDDVDYTEVAIYLKGKDESLDFIIDLDNHFKYDVSEDWLFVEYDGGETDAPVIYSHLVRIDEISYITDEV